MVELHGFPHYLLNVSGFEKGDKEFIDFSRLGWALELQRKPTTLVELHLKGSLLSRSHFGNRGGRGFGRNLFERHLQLR